MKNTIQTKNNSNHGFSTLELLIAFGILTLSLTAVILVVFGNRSLSLDTTLAQRALYLAERKLEETGAIGKSPDGIDAMVDTTDTEGIYEASITVSDDECYKVVSSHVVWDQLSRAGLDVLLSTIVSDPRKSEDVHGDCPDAPPTESWDNPTSLEIDEVISSGNKASDVDIVSGPNGVFALLTSNHQNNKPTFWVIDITDIDNVDDTSVVAGYEGVDDFNSVDSYVADDGTIYSFVATASSTAPLQVLTTTFPINYPIQPPTITRTGYDLGLSGSCVGVNPNCPIALTVQYKAGKVYVGTHRAGGDEFQVFTESNGVLTFYASKNLSHNVNDLSVVGNWAYLATSDDTGEVIALDVSDNTIPNYDDTKFDAPGDNDSDGMSIFSSSQYTYLGRAQDSDEPDFYILRNSDLQNTDSITDGVVGSYDMDQTDCVYKTGGTTSDTKCLNSGTMIDGITVWGNLAFLSSDSPQTEFQIWDVSDKSNPIPHIGCNAYSFPAKPTNIEFPGSLVYTGYPQGRELGFMSVDSNDALRVIYDPTTEDACTE